MVKRARSHDDDNDDDDILFRYPLPSASDTHTPAAFTSTPKLNYARGSGGLAPSKSTVYVSNLHYSLTNSDLHTIFSTFGKVARVSIVKHRHSRQSRGVAFILFVSRAAAAAAVGATNKKVLYGRTISASIAADNGRAAEFIRRRVYRDKSRCYECGTEGHLSYECPRNQLGVRERPETRGGARRGGDGEDEGFEDGGDGADFEKDNWASVVDMRGEEGEAEGREVKKMKMKKKEKFSYFSDESGDDE